MDSFAFVAEEYQDGFYTTTFRHSSSVKESLHDCTVNDFNKILSLATEAIKQLRRSAHTIQYSDTLSSEIKKHTDLFTSVRLKLEEDIKLLLQKNENERATLQSSYDQKINTLESKKAKLETELSVAEVCVSKMKEQFDSLKADTQCILDISIEKIIGQKEEQYEREIERIQQSHKHACETLEKQARERVHQCDAQHKESIENMRQLYSEKEKELLRNYEKTFVSSSRGKQGEEEFETIVTRCVSWPPMINMSKTSHGTDRHCKIRNCNSLFEIKNYTDDVPSKEVNKFERDMEENQDCPLGVFISLNTNIVGKKSGNFISMSWSSKSQLLLYINSFYSHTPEDIIAFIDICADLAWSIFKSANDAPEEVDTVIHLESRIAQAKMYVEKEIKRMTELLRTVNHNKTFLIDTINKQSTEYVYNIQQTRQALKGILEIFLGKSEEDNPPSSPGTHPELIEPTQHPLKEKSARKKSNVKAKKGNSS
jgi:hypothetical protein